MGERTKGGGSVRTAGNGPGGTQSIHRAVSVLRQIATFERRGTRLVDVTRNLGLERSTAHRILQCLASEQLITQKQPGRRYVLGPLAFELGLGAARRYRVAEICRPSLERIAERTGDVVFLSVRSGLELACVDRVEGSYPIKAYTLDVGSRRPLGFGAAGGALLSLLPEGEIRHVLRRNAAALRAYGAPAAADIHARVLRAKKRGYALNQRRTLGLSAIAIAFPDRDGEPYAAISLCAISSRVTEKRIPELVALIRAEVDAVSARLSEEAGPRAR